jgi:Trypsin
VTFGVPDDGEHPYVGLVYFEAPSGVFRCSGTLISPNVVLTAGHCTEEGGVTNRRTWVTFDEEVVIPDDVLALPDAEFGDWLDEQDQFIEGMAVPHPQYDDFAQFPLTFDIGAVVLSENVTGLGYATLPVAGLLDGLKGKDKSGFEVVGYGLQGFINPFFGAERARYKGDVRLVEVKSSWTGKGLAGAKFSNSPGSGNGSGGSCFGDSGGPVFHGTNAVVAVVSFGNTPCIGVDFQYRVDTADSLAFLRGVIATHG